MFAFERLFFFCQENFSTDLEYFTSVILFFSKRGRIVSILKQSALFRFESVSKFQLQEPHLHLESS